MEWYEIAIMILVVGAVFAAAILVVKKGLVPAGTIGSVAAGLDELHTTLVSDGEVSMFDRIVGYAAIAMHAADQLMKKDDIDSEDRKATAMSLVMDYAKVDGVDMSAEAMRAADSVIEAQCDIKGHGETEGVAG